MLNVLKNVLFDFGVLVIPAFLFGNLTMLLFLMSSKYKWEERHERIRGKRIRYILYLENLLVKKRQEQSKIDVD